MTETECVYCAVRAVICGLDVPAPAQYLKAHLLHQHSTDLLRTLYIAVSTDSMYMYRLPASSYIQQYVHQTDMSTDCQTHSSEISGAPTSDEQWYSLHGQSQEGLDTGTQ